MAPPVDPREPKDSDLEALFERTARGPSELERARLLAHAASLAQRRARQRWLYTRLVWPAAIAAAAAVAFLVVAPPGREQVVREAPKAPSVAASVAHEEVAEREPAPDVAEVEAEDAVATLLDDPSEQDPFDLGPLMAEEPER